MSDLIEKIRSRGHWQVGIRPINLEDRRVSNPDELQHILERTYVQFRGWCFPHLGQDLLTHYKWASGNGWVGQKTDWQHYVELWRLYQTGQFIHYSGMREDWQNQCELPCLYAGIEPGEALDVLDTLLRFSEIFEFAARLTFRPASYDQISMEIAINGLNGRTLWDKPGGLYVPANHRSNEDKYRYQRSFSFLDLADSKEPALVAAQELYRYFGWKPRISWLRDIQTELISKTSKIGR